MTMDSNIPHPDGIILPRGLTFRRLCLIAIMALAVRVAYVSWVYAKLGVVQESDAWYIHEIAKSLASGDGFVVDGMRVYNQSPGYPYFLSGFYRVSGHGEIVLLTVNIGLATLAAMLTVALAMIVVQSDAMPENLRPYRRGMLYAVAVLAVFSPANWLYIPMAAGENLLVPLLALFLCVIMRFAAPSRSRYLPAWVAAGTSAGLLAAVCLSVKAYTIFITPLPFLLWIGRGRRFFMRAIPLYALTILILLTPWTLKNYRDSGGYFVPFAAVSGEVFLDSNNPLADGRPSNVVTLPEIEKLGLHPVPRDKAKLKAGLDFLKADPGRALRLQARKLVYSFSPARDFMFEHRGRYRLFTPTVSRYAPTLFNAGVLFGFLMFLAFFHKRNIVWLTGLACFGVPLVLQQIFAAYTRYRYPFLYVGLVFAAIGWIIGIQKIRKKLALPG